MTAQGKNTSVVANTAPRDLHNKADVIKWIYLFITRNMLKAEDAPHNPFGELANNDSKENSIIYEYAFVYSEAERTLVVLLEKLKDDISDRPDNGLPPTFSDFINRQGNEENQRLVKKLIDECRKSGSVIAEFFDAWANNKLYSPKLAIVVILQKT